MSTIRRHKEELLSLLDEYERRKSILRWLEGKVNENGLPISLEKHEFQKAIWQDFSPEIYLRKAAQIGVSTIFILKCMYLLEMKGYNIIYTLPTLMNDVNKFVPSKVDPIIEKNGFMLDRDTTQQKQMGNGFWFFGGTMSEKEAISTSADVVLHDEVDRSNLEVVRTFKSRLGHSEYRRRWFFSNPSAPNRGVDEGWQRSDQKHWFFKCECGQGNYGGWQYLQWPDNVDYKEKCYKCIYCGREITDDMRRQGEWVAKYPDRDISGYWVSQMMASWIPCSSLIHDEITESQQFFNNFVLGMPYIGADVTINRDMILRNVSDATADRADTFMGVDVGAKLNVVIGNNEGLIKVLACGWDTLPTLMRSFDCRQAVLDALPETTKAKEFRDMFPRRVKLCYYRPVTNRAPSSQEVYEVNHQEQTLLAYRTEAIDRVIRDFSEGKIRVFIKPNEPWLVGGDKVNFSDCYVKHWENMYLAHDEEKDIKTWEHAGPDHFAHATVYYWLAKQIAGPREKHKVRVQ